MGKKGRRHDPRRIHRADGQDEHAAAQAARRWPALTGLRGLAALGVLLFHAFVLAGQPRDLPAPVTWLFAYGWSGVDVFFTLSAFLLTLPFLPTVPAAERPPALLTYGRNRLLRILPAYYAQMAVLLAVGFAGMGGALGWPRLDAGLFLANAAFLYGAMPSIDPMVPPWWTLPVELAFYLVLPLFARLLSPGRWQWMLLAIVASLAYRVLLMHAGLTRTEEVAWIEHVPGRLHQFLVGMLAAYAYARLRARSALPGPGRADLLAFAAGAAFIALPALGWLASGEPFQGGPVAQPFLASWHLFASLVVAVMLLALAAGAPRARKLLSVGPLQALGVVSYSLYLWHYPVMLGLREALGGREAIGSDFWPFLAYGLIFSTLAAAVSWWLVERPAQRWSRQAKLPA